jgi:hypothetical protein
MSCEHFWYATAEIAPEWIDGLCSESKSLTFTDEINLSIAQRLRPVGDRLILLETGSAGGRVSQKAAKT